MKRTTLPIFLLLLLHYYGIADVDGQTATQKPNVLFIMADDLGFNDLDWKDSTLHTPNLRNLAFHKNTALMTNSYVNQLCTPTRSAFMTGYYPFRVGTQAGVFLHMEPAGVPTMFPFLSENMRQLDYSTYLVGKWHLGYCKKEFLPTNRGFDYFYGFYGPQTGYFNHSADQYHRELKRVVKGLDLFEEVGNGKSVPDFSQNGVYSTRSRQSQLYQAFLHVFILSSSTPTTSSESHVSTIYPDQINTKIATNLILKVPRSYDKYCTRVKNRYRRIYCGMLTAMDFAIGRLVEYLKAANLYENTVIVFTSDNGGTSNFGASNAPLRGEKDTIWEGGTKTTTFVHSPMYVEEGGNREMMFHVVDWHATILSITGLEVDSYGDGINQWEYIRTNRPKFRRFQFVYNIADHGSAIRDGDYKLIVGNVDRKMSKDKNRTRLFRISTDPTESKDISRNNPKIVRRLLSKLDQLKKFLHKNVRKPLSLSGSPERFNGSYSSFWCDGQA
ncbi:Protein CBR-SUL-3 [Caenorhabditis briggsae]|uniref:Protein CBR-SUL-3 n=1 Tax=Caenorhabditis briggsae TaxID=6238 RepID=A8XPW7_CAEBR|nr:Protein CBR-SUL-3 [Caenorhabditis briggsae]CAP34693.2 Protein CBR-SUL-3 [Caenorhabditis briggsae]